MWKWLIEFIDTPYKIVSDIGAGEIKKGDIRKLIKEGKAKRIKGIKFVI